MYLYKVNKSICIEDYKAICNNMTMKEYSDRLTYALNIRGVSQSELARATGVKPQAIQYLCGQGKRSVHSVKIAEVLGINAKWLTDGIGNINSNEPSLPTQLDNNITTTHEPSYVLGGFDLWDDDTPLRDDATIGVDISKKDISNGEIYAIDHDGDLRVKMVYRLPGGVIRLRSFNSDDWPDEIYNPEDAVKIKIIGRVFWWSVLR